MAETEPFLPSALTRTVIERLRSSARGDLRTQLRLQGLGLGFNTHLGCLLVFLNVGGVVAKQKALRHPLEGSARL